MSSGEDNSNQQSLQNYEKDYLERLGKEKKSEDLQNINFHNV